MRAALRRSRILVLLTAVLTTVALMLPIGLTARAADVGVWVPTANGQVRIESLTPAKAKYSVGDVVTVLLRMESVAAAPRRDITGASDTLSNPSSCDWKAFPAGVAGKYNCARTGMPALTYTVTEDDASAGEANFSLTYTETPVDAAGAPNGAPVTSTISGTLPVDMAAPETRPEGEYVALASNGDYGFVCHRIPALTTAPNGDILAAWDGRPEGCGDAPLANSIIQRRSTDGGQTWGPLTTIAAGSIPAPKYGYSDPSYVTDREANKVFAFFLKSYDRGWGNSEAGTDPTARNVLHAAVAESSDNGTTWSEPRIITAAITSDAAWTSRFAASGEGIQLQYAPYEGRLIQQYTIKNNPAGGNGMQAVSVYSDDHGVSWKVGTPVGTGMDENKVVELSDGRVMLNSRSSSGPAARKVTISTDGGITYGDVTSDLTLIDPRNNASIIRAYPNAEKNSAKAKVLLFSNAANTGGRSNGTVRVSFDDGQTWSGSKVFEPGSMSYSTLTALPEEGKYGLFYEGANTQMRYTTISMEWLNVLPLSITAEAQTVNRGTNEVTFSATNLAETAVTFTPTFTLPGGWTASAVAPVTLAAGATGTFMTTVTVPTTADPGAVSMVVSADIGGKAAKGVAALTMALKPGQNPTKAIAVISVNIPSAQSGFGIANAFDGDVTTLWHTPYDAIVGVPVDVDMKLGDAPVQVALLEYVPRASGSNGIINGYEVWGGDTIAGLTKVAEGNFANSNPAKVVSLDGSYQYLRLRAISSYGDTVNKWVSAAEIRVRVAVPDSAAGKLPLTLENELAYQNNPNNPAQVFPPSNMFDGNAGTWFHSPWATAVTLPYNIDLSVGENGAALDEFVFTPKPGGTAAGDNNGRPLTWRILVGDSVADLTEVKSGAWADDNAAKTVPLDGVEGKFVRLQILTTAGDMVSVPASPQNNKYVAVAELEVFGTALPPVQEFLTVALARTDASGAPVKVGDKLTFTITYTNTSTQNITAYPRETNLADVMVGDAKNCRWGALAAGATQQCAFAFHTVTAADLAAGSFTPSVTFDATTSVDGDTVLQAGIVATLPAIEVKAVIDPTPTATATASPSVTPTVTVTAPAVTATSTNTVTATSSVTATTTSSATVTATSSTTATVTSSATATSTNTMTATSTATATATATATVTATATATQTATAPAVTVTPTTSTPTVKPTVTPSQRPVNVYTDPGYHEVNGRKWFTRCEPYSATERCFTSIWASQVQSVNGKLQWVTGWVFNNLTYLPMDKETWKGNKLASTNEWTTAEGRKWRTECGTPATGRDGCRSYLLTTVWEASSAGSNSFVQENRWVLNNMLSFN